MVFGILYNCRKSNSSGNGFNISLTVRSMREPFFYLMKQIGCYFCSSLVKSSLLSVESWLSVRFWRKARTISRISSWEIDSNYRFFSKSVKSQSDGLLFGFVSEFYVFINYCSMKMVSKRHTCFSSL